MPRGIRKEKSIAEEIQKTNIAEYSKKLLEIVQEWKDAKGKEILVAMAKLTPSDIAELQAQYKACMDFESFLTKKINTGKIAEAFLKERED